MMKDKSRILITGSNGFLGRNLLTCFSGLGYKTYGAVRSKTALAECRDGFNNIYVGDIDGKTRWLEKLICINVIIHCAARTHIMKDRVSEPLSEYRKVNVEGTLNLARQAAMAGIKRFVYISSIKVNGEQTPLGSPFSADDAPSPKDAYGVSKMEAEQGLKRISEETGLEVVIIRAPLVYGPGVKGNFASMIKLIDKGIPLPLGSVHNKRSLVALDNLVDLIVTCVDHPAASNETFLASDGEDVSTTELLKGIAKVKGKSARLIPVPEKVLMLAATAMGKKSIAQRLLGSLQVDISKTRNLLGWRPPVGVKEGLRRCFPEPHSPKKYSSVRGDSPK